jgi:flagellar biosynthesis GTPase FlhF
MDENESVVRENVMRIKRFHAQDMATALGRVRDELGEDAVIISTRTLGTSAVDRRRGLRGVEVVAGVDERPGASAVQQALSVAAVSTVAPEAARAAYALEMAAAGSDQAAAAVAPLSAVERGPIVAAPSFPRVSRDSDDADDLDALVPFAQALAAARNRANPTPDPLLGGAPSSSPPRGPTWGGETALSPGPPPARGGERAQAEPVVSQAFDASLARAEEPVPVSLRRGEPSSPPLRVGEGAGGWGLPSYVPPPLPPRRPTEPEPRVSVEVEPAHPAPGTRHSALNAAERVFDLLREVGLSDGAAEMALEQAITVMPPAALTDSDRLLEVALSRLVAQLPGGPSLTAESLAGRVVFFAGPAGVGKTTALLKAAIHLRRAGADVGIVGADVSRIGAPEQLARYGQVLRLPVEIAYDPEDLVRALASAPAERITLVDTAACGPGPDGLCGELKALLAVAPEGLVVLTVAAGTGEGDLRRLAAMGRATGAAAAAITKLDEAATPGTAAGGGSGVALNALAHLRLPLLLCSAGRDVLAGLSRVTAAGLAANALDALIGEEEAAAA